MLTVVAALAAALHTPVDPCSWDHVGADPYRSVANMTAALDDFQLRSDDKAEIKQKMLAHKYDDFVVITKAGIHSERGDQEYAVFRDMHSGHQSCHGLVKMNSWDAQHTENAVVYCAASGSCVIVPLVCNNISLVDKLSRKPEEAGGDEPIDVSPAAGPQPQLAPVEDRSFTSVVASSEYSFPTGGTGYSGNSGFPGGGSGGSGTPPHGPKPPASAPSSPSGPWCPCGGTPVNPPPPVSTIPEPTNLTLLVFGLGVMLVLRRLFRKR